MAALEQARPGGSRFVGGCVRNALLGREVDDIDIATQLQPQQVEAAARAAGLGVHPTGVEHGTLTLVAQHRPFEVTTLRRDVRTDGRRAVVAFTEVWEEDAARRDFHLNALYADAGGAVFDPTGAGLADLAARRVRFVGAPQLRIAEDYLRILRFFRFSAWYACAIDAEGLAACAARVEGLGRLSVERVWRECKKLLAAPDPMPALQAMAQSGVLAACLPENHGLDLVQTLIALDQQHGLEPDALLRFAALTGAGAEAAGRRLRLSRAEAERVSSAASVGAEEACAELEAGRLARALYWLGPVAAADRLRLCWAASGGDPADWRTRLEFALAYRKPRFPVTGSDLQDVGMQPGPALGAALRTLERWWVDDGCRADAETLLARARQADC
jgi:poly(A) polymerase